MSTENLIPELPSISTKAEGMLNKEEECDYYRQRFNSLKIVLDDFQNQLTMYKNRCLGVDTIVLALKESKQDNVKLTKHVKALETAISVLQKRLAKHGLSNSVNTQDTELFVPGASKQTLDNLAKENARLRSLLKQENGHTGKNQDGELEGMKSALEDAESENNQLRNKLKDMELIKMKLVRDYEGVIEKLTKEKEDEKAVFEEKVKALSTRQRGSDEKRNRGERTSVGSQINMHESASVRELKELLKQTVEKCSQLEGELPNVFASDASLQDNNGIDEQAAVDIVSGEEYSKLEARHQEAVLMNQRWQVFSKEREKQIQSLNDRIQELSDPHQMAAMIEETSSQRTAQLTHEITQLTQEVNMKDVEAKELRKQIQALSKELADVRKLQAHLYHPESSTIEILKQQIQVCTEDFNTERKDREQAVQKARGLQEENERLKAERTNLKQTVEQLKKTVEQQQRLQAKPPSYETCLSSNFASESATSLPPQYNNSAGQASLASGQRSPQYMGPVSQASGRRPPLYNSMSQGATQGAVQRPPQYASPVNQVIQASGQRPPQYNNSVGQANTPATGQRPPLYVSPGTQASSQRYPYHLVPVQESPAQFVELRGEEPQHALPYPYYPVASTASGQETAVYQPQASPDRRNYDSLSRQPNSNAVPSFSSPPNNQSMPPLFQRGGSVKEELTCPKCNNKFSDDILLSHIEECKQ